MTFRERVRDSVGLLRQWGLAGGRDELPLLALHRHAGIVADLLARPGEAVEQRGLAAIGVADQRDQRLLDPAPLPDLDAAVDRARAEQAADEGVRR